MIAYWSTLVSSAFDRGRPQQLDRDAARTAALELRQRGLTVADIAAALRLSDGAVRDLLDSGAGDAAPSPTTATRRDEIP